MTNLINTNYARTMCIALLATTVSACLSEEPATVDTPVNGTPIPQNTAPEIWGTPGTSATVGNVYSFTPSSQDSDGDSLAFSISNRPGWASFDTATGELRGQPTLGDVGSYGDIMISVSDGQVTTSLAAFAINVENNPVPPPNSAPTISGNPPGSVTVGNTYSFTPNASDADGDTLTFSVRNLPAWASFNIGNGRLTGQPGDGDVGVHGNITISVSDGQASASLTAFSINVESNSPPGNSAPVISGNPPTSVTVGNNYSFTPNASDADGDALTFSIQNLPGWASFDASNGGLAGQPGDGDVGVYGNITISVSDGEASVSLAAFSIEVTQIALGSMTVSWNPPTRNTDGTALTDLAGFVLYYGTASGSYSQEIRIENPGLSSYVVEDLPPDTYYVVATAFNDAGEESAYSGEASKTVTGQ